MKVKHKLFTKKNCIGVQTCVRTIEITDRNYGISVTGYVFEITQTLMKAAAKLG
jgi:hypothetical protein